jgi:hypothetical protein
LACWQVFTRRWYVLIQTGYGIEGRFATGTKGILLRKGLVVSRFTISIALIISTIIVFLQMNFMRNQDLGFRRPDDGN